MRASRRAACERRSAATRAKRDLGEGREAVLAPALHARSRRRAPLRTMEPVSGSVARSPAFQAHLERFRCSPSPTSTRSSSQVATTASAPPCAPNQAVCGPSTATSSAPRPARSPLKRPRPRGVSTPPRPDGTSAHFQPKPGSGDDTKPSIQDDPPASPTKKKKKRPPRPYADPSEYAHLGADPLQDYLDEGLSVLLCGINPGVKSAQLGLHCASSNRSLALTLPRDELTLPPRSLADANPTNHYWKCLAESGMTPRRLHPSEGPTLPSLGVGSTNLVARPTAEVRARSPPRTLRRPSQSDADVVLEYDSQMSEISNQEMAARVPGLLRKVVRHKPKCVSLPLAPPARGSAHARRSSHTGFSPSSA